MLGRFKNRFPLFVTHPPVIWVHATGGARFVAHHTENGAAHAGHCNVSDPGALLNVSVGDTKLAVKFAAFVGTVKLCVAAPPSDHTTKL